MAKLEKRKSLKNSHIRNTAGSNPAARTINILSPQCQFESDREYQFCAYSLAVKAVVSKTMIAGSNPAKRTKIQGDKHGWT